MLLSKLHRQAKSRKVSFVSTRNDQRHERAARIPAAHEAIAIDDAETRRRFYVAIRDASPPSLELRRLMAEDDPGVHLVD